MLVEKQPERALVAINKIRTRQAERERLKRGLVTTFCTETPLLKGDIGQSNSVFSFFIKEAPARPQERTPNREDLAANIIFPHFFLVFTKFSGSRLIHREDCVATVLGI